MGLARGWQWLVLALVLLVLGAAFVSPPARAEAVSARLTVQRIRGADLLGRVAGTFRLAVDTPATVRAVTFYLDGHTIGQATRYPFSLQLDTGDFPTGGHEIQAVVHLDDGSVTTSNRVTLDFRSRNWRLAMRQSMFLYAGLTAALGALGAFAVHRLLQMQPRLARLEQRSKGLRRRR